MKNNNPLSLFYKEKCRLCGNLCETERKASKGFCGADNDLYVSASSLHFGEEPPISGKRGSGTIFFTNCSMHCIYCQNYPVSQMGIGNKKNILQLINMMLNLQNKNAQNINLVTPSHYSFHIYEAVTKAKEEGLKIPIVWNTSSYENPETVKYINQIADIYLADIRYSNDADAFELSHVKNYTEIVFKNIKEFHRVKSNLSMDKNGVALKGVLVRVLLLPGKVNECKRILDFIHNELGRETFVSIMSQYVPYFKAHEHYKLKRRVDREEYDLVIEYGDKLNLKNAFIQEIAYTEE